MMKLLSLCCLLLVPLALLAQNAKIDSLKRVIETTKADTARATCHWTLAAELMQAGQYDEANRAAQEGLRLSRRIGFRRGEAQSLNQLGYIAYMTGQNAAALASWQAAKPIYSEIGDLKGVSDCYANLGVMHQTLGRPDSVLFYLERGHELDLKRGAEEDAAITLASIASFQVELARFPEALKAFQKALGIFTRLKDEGKVSFVLGGMGTLYARMDEVDLAIKYNRMAARKLEACRCDDRLLSSVYANLGVLERPASARGMNLRKSLIISKRLADWGNVANVAGKLAELMIEAGRMDSAWACIQTGDFATQKVDDLHALQAMNVAFCKYYVNAHQPEKLRGKALQGLEICRQTKELEHCRVAYKYMYISDSMLGDYKSALRHFVMFQNYEGKLRSQEKAREVGRLEAKYEADKALEVHKAQQAAERERGNWMLGSAGGGLLLLLAIAFTLFRGRRKEKRANLTLRSLNQEINQQKAEIEAMNAELTMTLGEVNQQRDQLQEQHAKIEDSIRYASRIQHAILPSETQLRESLPAHFIHYQPRDIVSGDFYWMTKHGGTTFFAAVDCTGHGVPGAFMSVLGSNLLHQIVDENQITEPDVILAELDRRISATLRQQFGGDSKDGMDVALVVLHEADENGTRIVDFAGAGRPLWHCHGGEITEYKSAKYSCGGSQHEAKQYPASRIEARTGDRLYLFSDGPVDQFGGPQGRKLGSGQLRAFLLETASLPVEKQGEAFAAFFNGWMGARKQLDDVLVAGISA